MAGAPAKIVRLCHSPTFRVGRDSQLSGGWERRFTTLPGAIHNSGPLIHNLIHKFWQGDGSNGDLCREIAVLTVRRARKKTSSTPSTTSRPKSRRGGDPGEYVVFAMYVSWPPHGILSMTSIARRLGRIQEAAQAPFPDGSSGKFMGGCTNPLARTAEHPGPPLRQQQKETTLHLVPDPPTCYSNHIL